MGEEQLTDLAVPNKAEAAMVHRLKQKAVKTCGEAAKAYADCCSGRVISVVWACREQLKAFSDCTHKHTNNEVLEEVKRRWIARGRPTQPDWEQLLDGL